MAIAIGALACASPAAALGAIVPGAEILSPRLAELAKPAVREAPPGVRAETLGLPATGPGSLLREGNFAHVYGGKRFSRRRRRRRRFGDSMLGG